MPFSSQELSGLTTLLTRKADNAALYLALTTAEKSRAINDKAGFIADPRYRLLRVDHRLDAARGNEFEVALVDDGELSVAFYDRVTLLHFRGINRQIAQNRVWRSSNSRHDNALRDITRKVFFDYLIQDHDILLADDLMTDGGRFNWHRQVSHAIEQGLHVLTYDSVTLALRSIKLQRELNNLMDQAWSHSHHVRFRALVSQFPLGAQPEDIELLNAWMASA